jgi:hypothetical protein
MASSITASSGLLYEATLDNWLRIKSAQYEALLFWVSEAKGFWLLVSSLCTSPCTEFVASGSGLPLIKSPISKASIESTIEQVDIQIVMQSLIEWCY